MNLAHVHLVMNHVPTVGAVAVLGILIVAFARRSDHLTRAALELLFLVAVLTLPVYVSGAAAQQELRGRQDISVDAIRTHHDAALIGFTLTELAGFVGWVALWQSRRRRSAAAPRPRLVAVATVLLVAALAVMARAANLGGQIRHPEISAAGAAAAAGAANAGDPDRFITAAINVVALNSTWAWPAAEVVHFLGFSLSIGVLLAVNLRILGVMRRVPFADVHRLLPWGMLGFGANLITGMFFFVGQSGQYTSSAPFYWKVVFLVIAGANFLYLTVFGKPWHAEAGEATFDAGPGDKAMAILSMASWLGVLYAGRMLPFLGKAF